MIITLLRAGLDTLLEYLSAHVLLCLVPAFFIAGAMSALIPKEAVTKYLGPEAKKYVAYPVAALAGFVLAVCSCTVLPLFAGIWKRGAGLGPAVTFLFIAPAINILAVTYTGSLIGMDIALARGALAVIFGISIGLIMAAIFKQKTSSEMAAVVSGADKLHPKTVLLFVSLVAILVVGTAPIDLRWRGLLLIPLVASPVGMSKYWLTREEVRLWLAETFRFAKMIFPLLLAGVFVAGILRELIPNEVVETHVGANTLSANFIAVLFGVFMYFPTLVEVPIARMFLDLGMAKGPLLAYLLADPELSLQSVLVVSRIIGWKKNAAYVVLVAILCTAAGLIFGYVLSVT